MFQLKRLKLADVISSRKGKNKHKEENDAREAKNKHRKTRKRNLFQ